METTAREVPSLRFSCEKPFKGFAKLEGIASITPDGVAFEYAMTESVATTPKGVVTKELAFTDLTEIEAEKHLLGSATLVFSARSMKTLEDFPTVDPVAFEIDIPRSERAKVDGFVLAVKRRLYHAAPARAEPSH